MAGQRSLSFSEFFKFELKVSLFLLLFAFLVSVFVSLLQGIIIRDGYALVTFLLFGLAYLVLGFLLGLFSTIVGYLSSSEKRASHLKLFGVAFPSGLVASAYLIEVIHPPIAPLFPGIRMVTCYGVFVIAAFLIAWGVWRFTLRRSLSSAESAEFLQDGIIFMALVAIWTFSMDIAFIKGPSAGTRNLVSAFAWLVIALLGFPLARTVSRRLNRGLSPSLSSLSKRGKFSVAVFFLLVIGHCFLLAESYNPRSPDRYAISSHAVASSGEKPNVFLFVLDTFRADQLFDYGEELTPNLTSLFPDFVVFKQAYSPSSWTLPATGSILSCLYPTTARRVMSKSCLDLHSLPEILAESVITPQEFPRT